MASTQTSTEQVSTQPPQEQSSVTNGETVEIENGMNGLAVSGDDEFALHRACAEGRLEDVREILSRNTGSLESLDPTTGCTPIVLAIRLNHPELVQTLLQAGAIVPPPGVTNDQHILSILYPQPMYNMPPFMHQQPHLHQQQHQQYQQHEFYPQQQQQLQQHQQQFYPSNDRMFQPYPSRQRKESDAGQANLPPVDVAKSIPCRNFPNCKYANNCIFFHPRPNQFLGQPGYGYDAGFQGYQVQGYPQPGGPGGPGAQPFVPSGGEGQHSEPMPTHQEDEQAQEKSGQESDLPEKTEEMSQSQIQQQQQQPQQSSSQPQFHNMPPPFVPAFQQTNQMMQPPSDFGGSPISPSMLGGSLPSIPPADQFFAAASPPVNGFMGIPPFVPMPMMNQSMNRRQSFNQFGIPINPNGKPFGHGKKPSFSGGPRPPFAGSRPNGPDYGKWKDGLPPPCAFFIQGKCRNGEMCKFPHVDAEGNDLRHPDIVAGNMLPMPPPTRVVRRPGPFGTFDPAFKQQQLAFLQQQRAAVQQAQNGQSPSQAPSQDLTASQIMNGESDSALVDSTVSLPNIDATPVETGSSTLPPKPSGNLLTPAPTIVRSASQPGVQRVHANGLSSRSQSPAPSNVSFHGNGHPRRNNSRPGFTPMMNGANGNANGNTGANGPRSASAETKPQTQARRNQRVPGADEFPALGGMDSKQTSPIARGRTAAEVLSAPAPEKPVVKKEVSVDSKSDDQNIEMDSDNESDGVVISVKPSTSTPAVNGTAAPASTSGKLPTISFAKMASAITANTENTPIAVKA